MKTICLFLLSLGTICSFAQDGFYLQPEAGIGLTNIISPLRPASARSGILHYNMQLGVGYEKNKWQLQAGLSYFTTGFKLNIPSLVFENNIDSATGMITGCAAGSFVYTYTHIAIPVSIGYKLALTKRLALVPAAGIAISYNTGCNVATTISTGYNHYRDYSQKEFDNNYRRISEWATARVAAEYGATRRISIVMGLQGTCMLASMIKAPQAYTPGDKQNNYAFAINLGAKWYLARQGNKGA